jgi:hypothetical protein
MLVEKIIVRQAFALRRERGPRFGLRVSVDRLQGPAPPCHGAEARGTLQSLHRGSSAGSCCGNRIEEKDIRVFAQAKALRSGIASAFIEENGYVILCTGSVPLPQTPAA